MVPTVAGLRRVVSHSRARARLACWTMAMGKRLPDSDSLLERFPQHSIMRPAAFVVILAIGLASCSSTDTTKTTTDTTATTADSSVGTPATDQALAAGEAFRAVPDGYLDCGHTNLSSGWPTTTVFDSEIGAVCITEAARTRTPSQQSFSGRDNAGGLDGRILRVEGASEVTMITYHIEPDGAVSSTRVTCQELTEPISEPPLCSSAPAP